MGWDSWGFEISQAELYYSLTQIKNCIVVNDPLSLYCFSLSLLFHMEMLIINKVAFGSSFNQLKQARLRLYINIPIHNIITVLENN